VANTNGVSGFRVERGFRIELVASESLVSAPAAMVFDENGRLFVAEMRDYPDQRNQEPHLGRIRVLEDTNADGVFDTSTVFAEDLPLPSALACYDGGIFVGATPEILYLKNGGGGGGVGVRRVAFGGFGGISADNPRPGALLNSFAWGQDGRIYGGLAGIGGLVTAAGMPSAPEVALTNCDFSFDPRAGTLTAEAGGAQSGLCFDLRGRRFVSDGEHPLRMVMYDRRYFLKNPLFPWPPGMTNVIPPAPLVYRAARQGTNAATWLAQASGSVVYRGSAFPPNYQDNVFVADAANGLIHRVVLRENGLEPVGLRPQEEMRSEFLSSTDADFHPAQLVCGPDGALYVADFRKTNSGRIFRIIPDRFQQPKTPQLAQAPTAGLVALLAYTNGWHRETAARLLYARQDRAAFGPLTNMVNRSQLAIARLNALCALAGQGLLTEAVLLRGLQDKDALVRERAVLLVERFARNGVVTEPLWNQLTALAADDSIRVRYQLAFTLGEIRARNRVPALAQLIRRDPANPWMQGAVLSSLADDAPDLLALLGGDKSWIAEPAPLQFLGRLARMIGVRDRPDEAARVINFVLASGLDARLGFILLAELGEGLQDAGGSLQGADPQMALRQVYDRAVDATLDDSRGVPLRVAGIRLRGLSPPDYVSLGDLYTQIASPGDALATRIASIATLGRSDDPGIATNLLSRFQYLELPLRRLALDALLARADRTPAVLAALESGLIQPVDFTPTQIELLTTHPRTLVREQAVRLFGPAQRRPAAFLDQFKPALQMAGAPARGQNTFRVRCAVCHETGSAGVRLGPDLAGARLRGKQTLLNDILRPSAEIQSGYQTQVLETKHGALALGIVADQTAETVTLRQLNGNAVAVVYPRRNIFAIEPRDWSLMPEGLEQRLSNQDLADLLAYLEAGG
jgi:putative membrane-bound dehydrogenase-like protein